MIKYLVSQYRSGRELKDWVSAIITLLGCSLLIGYFAFVLAILG